MHEPLPPDVDFLNSDDRARGWIDNGFYEIQVHRVSRGSTAKKRNWKGRGTSILGQGMKGMSERKSSEGESGSVVEIVDGSPELLFEVNVLLREAEEGIMEGELEVEMDNMGMQVLERVEGRNSSWEMEEMTEMGMRALRRVEARGFSSDIDSMLRSMTCEKVRPRKKRMTRGGLPLISRCSSLKTKCLNYIAS
jgi:hypothetical protein